jgi:hypothetical protein
MDTSAAAYVSYKDFAEFLRGHGTPSLAASFGSTSSSYNRITICWKNQTREISFR